MPSLRSQLSKTREEEKKERQLIVVEKKKKKKQLGKKRFDVTDDGQMSHHYLIGGLKTKQHGVGHNSSIATDKCEEKKVKTKPIMPTRPKKFDGRRCCERSSNSREDMKRMKDIDHTRSFEQFLLNNNYHTIPLSPSETDSSNYSFSTLESSSHSDMNSVCVANSSVVAIDIPTSNNEVVLKLDIDISQSIRIMPPLIEKKLPSELGVNVVDDILHNEGVRYDDGKAYKYNDGDEGAANSSSAQSLDNYAYDTESMSNLVGFANLHISNASRNNAKMCSQERLVSLDYFGVNSLTASKCESDQRSLRSKSEGGLRSAVRNLESAFIGSRASISAPKMGSIKGCPKQVKHHNSESLRDTRGFLASPGKSRNKHAEVFRSIPRPSPHEFKVGKAHLRRNPSLNRGVIPPLSSRVLHKITNPGATEKNTVLSQPAMSQGYLQCITKNDGFPSSCFTLTVENSDDMLLARPCGPGSFHQSVYTIHGCKITPTPRLGGAQGWKAWIKKDYHDKSLASLVGEMEVSTKILRESETCEGRTNDYEMVSEFVLYDARTRVDVVRSQSSRFVSTEDHKAYRTVTLESDRNPSSSVSSGQRRASTNHIQKYLASSARWSSSNKGPLAHRPDVLFGRWDEFDLGKSETRHIFTPSDPSHNYLNKSDLELSAVVIKTPVHLNPSSHESAWERITSDASSSPCSKQIVHNGSEECVEPLESRKESSSSTSSVSSSSFSSCITMLLPSQHHSLPSRGRSHGPTSLIDRWKSGGKCDCGGWDLGCGMKVFCSAKNCSSSYLAQHKPLHIYSQGQSPEVMFSLLLVREGFFVVRFHRQLISSLKAFATSVAILHDAKLLACASDARRTSIEHLVVSIDCDGKPDRETMAHGLFSSSNATMNASSEACKDASVMWCPPNPQSPFGRS